MSARLLERPLVLDRQSPLVVAGPHHVRAEARRRGARSWRRLPLLETPASPAVYDRTGQLTELPEELRRLAPPERARWMRALGFTPVIGGGDLVTAETCPRVDIVDGGSIAGTSEGVLVTSPTYAGSGASTMGTGGFWYPSRAIRVLLRGVLTTASSSQGNLTLNWRLDSTSGASLGAGAALALAASQTNLSWEFEGHIVCRTVGTSGTLLGMGRLLANSAAYSTAANEVALIPASAPATATIDTTANHTIVITVTLGSASDSMTVKQAFFEVLN